MQQGQIFRQNWMATDEIRKLMDILNADREHARFVGGAVRDSVLNRPVSDVDLAIDLLPDAVMELLEKAEIKAIPTGIAHGTVTAVVDGKAFEITTLRKDVKTNGRHADVEFTDNWAEDASRRDFTGNALYADMDGHVYDYYDGIKDLREGVIRFIGEPSARIAEDYLRILRFFRFTAHYGIGDIEPEGLAASVAAKDKIKTLSSERIGKEVLRLLQSVRAGEIWSVMLENDVVDQIHGGLCCVDQLEKLVQLETRFDFCDPVRRLAALWERNQDPSVLQSVLALSNHQNERVVSITEHEKTYDLPLDPKIMRRDIYLKGREKFFDHFVADLLDHEDAIKHFEDAMMASDAWEPPRFPVMGKDVLERGTKPGPKVGEVLKSIETWWVNQDFAPRRKACLAYLDELISN